MDKRERIVKKKLSEEDKYNILYGLLLAGADITEEGIVYQCDLSHMIGWLKTFLAKIDMKYTLKKNVFHIPLDIYYYDKSPNELCKQIHPYGFFLLWALKSNSPLTIPSGYDFSKEFQEAIGVPVTYTVDKEGNGYITITSDCIAQFYFLLSIIKMYPVY